jgi:hypothetical protein
MAKTEKPKGKPGRKPGRIQDTQLQMRASVELIELIDTWREQQPDQPPRSVAIRRLIERGIKYRGK